MDEWKDIDGYEGLYQVSRCGDVRSLPRTTTSGRVLKPMCDKDGYKKVCLCKGNKKRYAFVHRLVAAAFVQNEQGLPVVNHKDQNKQNNTADNLEWCTVRYNTNYGDGIERRGIARRVPILQYDKTGNFVRAWSGRCEIAKALGFNGSNITSCCTGHRKTAHGFIWRYAEVCK